MSGNNAIYRKMVARLLTIYRNERCLWDATSKEYQRKPLKQAAVDKLLQVIRTVEPDAERVDVLKKLNCLRTCYKKERKKVEASLQCNDEVYEPRLWYYHLMTFLDEPLSSTTECSYLGLNRDEGSQDVDHKEGVFVEAPSYKEEYLDFDGDTSHDNEDHLQPSSSHLDNSPKHGVKRRIEDSTLTNNIVSLLSDCIKRPKDEDRKEDRHDVYCKSLAMKFRHLDNHQRILAEKLINDVLYEAELGNLSIDFKLARSICASDKTNCNDG